MTIDTAVLSPEGLKRFAALEADAVRAVTDRFYSAHGSAYQRFGERGRAACSEDLAFHLDFLRPVLEFGLLQPMVDYLVWLGAVLSSRAIPTEHVVQSLDWLGKFFADNMPAGDGQVVAAALSMAKTGFLSAERDDQSPRTAIHAWPQVTGFEAALLSGQQQAAHDIALGCLNEGHTLIDIEQHIIQPALYRVGEKWQANQVTVAQEHLATAIAQSVMTVGLERSQIPPSNGNRVLLACVAGNSHALGLQMVADAFRLAGWDVQYLGANTPTPAVVAQAVAFRPDLVGLSVSFAQQLPAVRDIIAQLKLRLGDRRPAVMLGGLAVNRSSQLATLVGADAFCTDAQTAVAYAAETTARS